MANHKTVTLSVSDLRGLVSRCRENEIDATAYRSALSEWSNQHSQDRSGLVQDLATKIRESDREARTVASGLYEEVFRALRAGTDVDAALRKLLENP